MTTTRHLLTIKSVNKAENLSDHTYDTTGTFEIGRSTFGITEKKCSRKQMLIQLDAQSNYYIIANGVNPSYLKKYDKDFFVQMTKGEEYELEDGDSFSLLYEMLTFSVSISVNPKFIDTPKKKINTASSTTTSTNKRKKDADSDNEEDNGKNTSVTDENKKHKKDSLPECPHGKGCYRKNPTHFEEYSHPWKDEQKSKSKSTTTTAASTTPAADATKTTPPVTSPRDDEDKTTKPKSSSDKATTANPTANSTDKSKATPASTTPTPATNVTTVTNNNNKTSNGTKPNYKKLKINNTNKFRTLCFPFISTFAYNFKPSIAADIVVKEIKSYLDFHKGEDDIKLVMTIDKSLYTDELASKINKGINDERFSIIQCDTSNSNEQYDVGCRFISTETTWRLKKTPQNKVLYDIINDSAFNQEVKQRYPNPGTVGNIYSVPITDSECKAKKEYNIDAIFLAIGPNMNEQKSNYIEDYAEASPLLTKTYQSLFSTLDNYDI